MVSRKIGAAMSLDRASSAEAFTRSSGSKEKRTRIRRVLEGSEEQGVVAADRHPHSPDRAFPDKAGGRRKRRRLFRYYDDSDTVAELSSNSRRDPHGCADPQFHDYQSPFQEPTSPLRAKSVRQKATPSPSVATCESSDDHLSSFGTHLAQLLNEFDSPREAVRALEYTLEQHTVPSWYECVEEDNDVKCNDYHKSRKHCMKRRDDGEIDSDGGSQYDESKDNETRLEVLATFRQQVKEVVSNWMENDARDDGLHRSNSSATLRDLALQVDRCLESMRQSDADKTNALASGAGLHIALPCRRQPRLPSSQADGQSGGSRLSSPPRVVVQCNGNQQGQANARSGNPPSLVPVVTPDKQCVAASTRDLASTGEKQMPVPAKLGSVFFDKPKTGYHLFCREWYAQNRSIENCAANSESIPSVATWHALPKRDMEVALFAATKAWTRLLADEKDDFSDRVLVEFPPDPPKPRLCHAKIMKNRPIKRSDFPKTSSFESRQGVHQSGTPTIHLPENVLTPARRKEGLNELVPVSPNLESFAGGLFSTFHNDASGYVKKPSKQDIRRQRAYEVHQSTWLEFRALLSEGMQLEKIARSYRTSFADDAVTTEHDARYNVARRKEGTDSLLFEGINLGHPVTEKSLSRLEARMATLIRERTCRFESALLDSSETCRVYATKQGKCIWLQLVMTTPARDRGGDETQLPKNSSSLNDEMYLAHFPEASDKNRDRAPGSSGHTKCKRLIVMAVHGSPVLVWSLPSLTVYSQQLKSRVLDVLQLALVPSGSSQHSKGK
jgi:hypothetical protein